MKYKKQLYFGLALFAAGALLDLAGIASILYESFKALKISGSAGIGAVGGALSELALISIILGLFVGLAGIALMIVSLVRSRRR